jgi:hypothetical protein
MARSLRYLAAMGSILIVLPVLSGCTSTPGTGDKAKDMETFKGGPMPPEAAAKMQAAMANAGRSAQQPHGGPSDAGQAQGGSPGQAQAQAAMQEARDKAQQSHGPN